MNELQRLNININGEIPEGKKTTVRVIGVTDPAKALANCKQAIKSFLLHQNLDENSTRWNSLLPDKITRFINQLNDDDYRNDELLYPVRIIIYDMKKLRQWEWYSSNEFPDGFEIVLKGSFAPRFVWFIHCQHI